VHAEPQPSAGNHNDKGERRDDPEGPKSQLGDYANKQRPRDEAKDKPTRPDQARQVVEYANDLRAIIEKLLKRLLN
jgi:hypothetical protein